MVIADTSVWVDFLRGAASPQCDLMASLLEEQAVATCDRVLQELLQGASRDADFRELREKLLALPCFNLGGVELALAAARNYRRMRERAFRPRSATDVLIATFCIQHGHELLHNDRDFDFMARNIGLKVVAAA